MKARAARKRQIARDSRPGGTEGRKQLASAAAGRSAQRAWRQVAARLREERADIEEALLARSFSKQPPTGGSDYAQGLRAAITAGLDHGIETIERGGEGESTPVPPELVTQAQRAARFGVSIDVIVRPNLGKMHARRISAPIQYGTL